MNLSGVKGERGPAGGTERQILASVLNDVRDNLSKPGEMDEYGNRWMKMESISLRQIMVLMEHYNTLLAEKM